MTYTSPISPGLSWYEASVGDRPAYPALDGSMRCDVLIIGGGYTGLSAAHELASRGVSVILVEQARLGDGASGRNGGQIGTGQRAWPEEIEVEQGLERARALFAMAEDAKSHLLDFAARNSIDMDYVSGQISAVHKPAYLKEYQAHPDIMAERFNYPHIRWMDAGETAERIGSQRYHGAIRDTGTGHIHPLKFLIGLGKAASQAGAQIYENTRMSRIFTSGGKVIAETPQGKITAEHALVAVNAYGGDSEPYTAAHVMPIGSFIGTTEPLADDTPILPCGESVDDSRFVVRYFRKTKDNRLLFGGREIYSTNAPNAIEDGVRKQIAEIYPELKNARLSYAWGGYVGITIPRKPFVRQIMPGVTSIGGFSGHGVMLSNYTGKLYAEALLDVEDRLALLRDMKIPRFPGGRKFRSPLLFLALSWFALRDRL